MSKHVMREWLEYAFTSCELSEDSEGYLLGRGIAESRIRDLGIVQWDIARIADSAPDPMFRDWKSGHGPKGDRFQDRICIPIRNPRGALLGLEARTWNDAKRVTQFLLPDAHWNPVFLGLTPTTMNKIWGGGNVWIVEGVFDMGALEQIIPASDAALATLRARVSSDHALFLQRFARGCVNVVYDNDETGQRQTYGYIDPATNKRRWGAVESLSRVGVRARAIPYTGGKDPGEIWDRGGVAGLRRAFSGNI